MSEIKTNTRTKSRVAPARELLLVEIERRCPQCEARVTVPLTKEDAYAYHEFECTRCEAQTDDALTERDLPEWWEELMIRTLRTGERHAPSQYEPSSAALRLSEDARRTRNSFGEED